MAEKLITSVLNYGLGSLYILIVVLLYSQRSLANIVLFLGHPIL